MNEKKQAIVKSLLFDAEWYRIAYHISEDPATHYLNKGWKLGFNPSDKFSTSEYLKLNRDVAEAKINPLLHYELYGKKEGRMICTRDLNQPFGSDKFQKITAQCNLDGKGLEIGPSFNPICPKRKGYDIEIMDHLDADGLRKKCGENKYVSGNLLE